MIQATRIITCFGMLALAASLPLSDHEGGPKDTYVPSFSQPGVDTIWTLGHNYTVQWDTKDAPPVIDDFCTTLYLVITLPDNMLQLAEDFKFTDGQVEITAPTVPSGQYRLFLLCGYWNSTSPFFVVNQLPDA